MGEGAQGGERGGEAVRKREGGREEGVSRRGSFEALTKGGQWRKSSKTEMTLKQQLVRLTA